MHKDKELLKHIWESYTFDDIINAGFEYNMCSAEQLINAAAEFEHPDSDNTSCIDTIDKIEELIKEDKPSDFEIAKLIEEEYDIKDILWHWDNDEIIDYLEGSIELDKYVEEHSTDDTDYDVYTFKDFLEELEQLPNYKLKNVLCDLVMSNHHISNEELIKKLLEKIN